jgi:hypothetical protein
VLQFDQRVQIGRARTTDVRLQGHDWPLWIWKVFMFPYACAARAVADYRPRVEARAEMSDPPETSTSIHFHCEAA